MTKANGVLPTKRQVIALLEKEIEAWHLLMPATANSVHVIRCLELALAIVKEWKMPARKGNR